MFPVLVVLPENRKQRTVKGVKSAILTSCRRRWTACARDADAAGAGAVGVVCTGFRCAVAAVLTSNHSSNFPGIVG